MIVDVALNSSAKTSWSEHTRFRCQRDGGDVGLSPSGLVCLTHSNGNGSLDPEDFQGDPDATLYEATEEGGMAVLWPRVLSISKSADSKQ